MALNVGSITADLGATFDPKAFYAFDGAMKKSAASAGTFERTSRKSSAAMEGVAATSSKAGRSAAAAAGLYQDAGGKWRNASGQFASGAEKAAVGVDKMEGSSRRGSAAMSKLGSVAKTGALAGVAALGYGLVKSVGKAADFESQLSSLGSVSGATGRQMGQFRQQALKAGADTKYSALEAAQAQTELAKGGLSVSNIMGGGLKAALALAAAGELDLSDAAGYTANAMNLFQIKGAGSVHVADALATAANATTADVGDFGMALAQGGAAAKNAGLSFDQTVVALETLAKAGTKGSDAGTSLKAALTQIAKPTDESASLMERLGINFFDANEKMKPMGAIAGMLRDKLGGLTAKQRQAAVTTIAGTDGMRTLLALYSGGPKTVDGFAKGLAKQGSAAQVAAKKQDNLKGKIEQLKGSFETAMIIVGSELLPGVTKGAEGLTKEINKMAADGTLKEFGQQVGAGMEAAGRSLPYLVAGLKLLSGAVTLVTAPGRALIAVVTAVGQAFSGNFAGAADTMLGMVQKVIGGVRLMVSALAAIPGPIGAPFRAAEHALDGLDAKIRRLRASVQATQAKAKIDVVLTGDRSAAQKIAAIRRIPNLPPKIQRILASDASARNKLQAIKLIQLQPKIQKIVENGSTSVRGKIAQLKALGIPPKWARLLANNNDAMAGIDKVLRAANALPASKTVTLTTRHINIFETKQLRKTAASLFGKNAQGRTSGASEHSLVGEGGGPEYVVDSRTGAAAKTTGPTFMALAPQDYVIPTEQKYRGRALGLMAALAGDLGVSGYARGRAARRGPRGGRGLGRSVPAALDPYRLPVDQIQAARDDAKTKADKDTETIRSTPGDIKQVLSTSRDTKLIGAGKHKRRVATEPAKDARKKLPGLRRRLAAAKLAQKADQAAFKQRDRELTEAKAYQEKIDAQQGDAELGRIDMDTGNKTGNLGLYNSGKKKRADALAALKGLLIAARKHVKDPAYSRDLDKQIGQAGLDVATDATDKFDAEKAAEPEMLTAAEQARADQLDAAAAMAALTETTADDKAIAAQEVGFREAVLGRIQGTGRNDWVATAAQSVKSARDTLKSLTETAAPPDPAELKRNTEEQLASLYQQYGSNFERAAGAKYFGAGPTGAAGGGDTIVHQTMNFPRQPDPMTWAAGVKFNLEVM